MSVRAIVSLRNSTGDRKTTQEDLGTIEVESF